MAESFRIRPLVVSPCETNCYIAADPRTRDALIIDPGDDADLILQAIGRDGLSIRGIVNTHGHADHIGANGPLKERFGCPIMIHELDADYLADPELNLSGFLGQAGPLSPPGF